MNVEHQVVCRNPEGGENLRSWVQTALYPMGLVGRVQSKQRHCLVRVYSTDPVRDVVQACRDVCFAYLRVIAWEAGGGIGGGSGMAQCVAGLDGSPIAPVVLYDQARTRPNGRQALFCSREGLLIASAAQNSLEVVEYRVKDREISEPMLVLRETAGGGWEFDGRVSGVVKAVREKLLCESCTHSHYYERKVDGGEEEEGCEEDDETKGGACDRGED
jgi:hypothetical protein